ncbi:MAG: hypothetical protein WD404_00875 [Solirubrobacterales bacterium]
MNWDLEVALCFRELATCGIVELELLYSAARTVWPPDRPAGP